MGRLTPEDVRMIFPTHELPWFTCRVTHLARILVQGTFRLHFPHPLAKHTVSALDDMNTGSCERVRMGEIITLRPGLVNLLISMLFT